ncbi:MAG TPA: hypothetical protein DEB46_06880, partial [Myxococcales bacterium]|nr:hypothetical protein [Myxococcales bacterium]
MGATWWSICTKGCGRTGSVPDYMWIVFAR